MTMGFSPRVEERGSKEKRLQPKVEEWPFRATKAAIKRLGFSPGESFAWTQPKNDHPP